MFGLKYNHIKCVLCKYH